MTESEILARVRLLSSARVQRYGRIPEDAGVWWEQITKLAVDLDLPITWEQFNSVNSRLKTWDEFLEDK